MNEQSGSRWEPANDETPVNAPAPEYAESTESTEFAEAADAPRTMPTKTKVLLATAAGVFLMGVGGAGFALGQHVGGDGDEIVPASYGFADPDGDGNGPPQFDGQMPAPPDSSSSGTDS